MRRVTLYLVASVVVWVGLYFFMHFLMSRVPNFDTRTLVFRGRYLLPIFSGFVLLASSAAIIYCSLWWRPAMATLLTGLFILVLVDNVVPRFEFLGLSVRFLMGNLSIIGIGICLGKLLCRLTVQKSWIVPLAMVAMVADLWSSVYGLTAQLTEKGVEVLRHFLLFYPMLGAPEVWERTYQGFRPFLGMGDMVFISLFLELCRLYELRVKATFNVILLGGVLALGFASYAERAIPALPFIAAGFLVVNFSYLQFRKREIIQGFLFMIVLVFLLWALFKIPGIRRVLLLEG